MKRDLIWPKGRPESSAEKWHSLSHLTVCSVRMMMTLFRPLSCHVPLCSMLPKPPRTVPHFMILMGTCRVLSYRFPENRMFWQRGHAGLVAPTCGFLLRTHVSEPPGEPCSMSVFVHIRIGAVVPPTPLSRLYCHFRRAGKGAPRLLPAAMKREHKTNHFREIGRIFGSFCASIHTQSPKRPAQDVFILCSRILYAFRWAGIGKGGTTSYAE